MYFDALSFLEDERDTFRPYEALVDLTDEQLERPVEAAHGWSGRDLMGHLCCGRRRRSRRPRSSPSARRARPRSRRTATGTTPGAGDRMNDEHLARFRALPMAEVRACSTDRGRAARLPDGRARVRWIKHADHQNWFFAETIEHYEDHAESSRRSWRRRDESGSGNGHVPPGVNGADASDEAALDALDAEPLDAAEAAAGAAAAGDEATSRSTSASRR